MTQLIGSAPHHHRQYGTTGSGGTCNHAKAGGGAHPGFETVGAGISHRAQQQVIIMLQQGFTGVGGVQPRSWCPIERLHDLGKHRLLGCREPGERGQISRSRVMAAAERAGVRSDALVRKLDRVVTERVAIRKY